jgi:hypothetical protein
MQYFPDICLIIVGVRVGISKSGECSLVLLLQRDCAVTGKFTWVGKYVEYILNHPDFNAMTKEK